VTLLVGFLMKNDLKLIHKITVVLEVLYRKMKCFFSSTYRIPFNI